MGFLGAALGGLLGLGGAAINASQMPDYEDIAKENRKFQERENKINRDFGLHLLNISRPAISSKDLGNLLFAQNEQAYNQQINSGLKAALLQNTRTGSPYSAHRIAQDYSSEAATQRGDRAAQARLQGIMGVLPGAAALQTAGTLGHTPAPQMDLQNIRPNTQWGDLMGGAGALFSSLMRQYGGGMSGSPVTTAVGNMGF